MKRRDFAKATIGTALGWGGLMGRPGFGWAASENAKDALPEKVDAILRRVVRRGAEAHNTDWDGTMAVEAVLRWSERGFAPGLDFAKAWFEYHVENDPKLTDEELYDSYTGPRSRVVRGSVLPFTMYSGLFGLAFPCHELFKRTGDERARQVCLDLADALLHQASRTHLGLILHDDSVHPGDPTRPFSIPDTIYFAARALMIGSVLDDRIGEVYRRQAVYQATTSVKTFLDEEKGLAKTIVTPEGIGKTYWCRASGWLMYLLVGVLRYLPKGDPALAELAGALGRLADGVARVQGPNGGLHVLTNRPDTPEETSSTAMYVASVREAVRKGWIEDRYRDFLEKGWRFVERHVRPDGTIHGVYTGWAVPAEREEIIMDRLSSERGWIPAVVLFAADEMTQ